MADVRESIHIISESGKRDPVVYTGMLLRNAQSDNGQLPYTGPINASPDLIGVQQNTYASPSQQFGTAQAYRGDQNMPFIMEQNNNIYVRGKNMGSAAQGGNVFLYWTPSTLANFPKLWLDYPLTTLVNNNPVGFVELPSVAPGGISVGQTPFNFTPTNNPTKPPPHYCLVGAVNSAAPYDWPPTEQLPPFDGPHAYDDFVVWLRSHPNVCSRNITVIANPNAPSFQRQDNFSNPGSEQKNVAFLVECTNVPDRTTIQLLCTALGINTSGVISPSSPSVGWIGPCPAGFNNGLVTTSAFLPPNTSWPPNASIKTTSFVAVAPESPAYRYAHDFGESVNDPSVIALMEQVRQPPIGMAEGRLVALGETVTAVYQPGVN